MFSSVAQSRVYAQTHAVLRNTYMLLSLTLIFSAMTAAFSMLTNARPMGPFVFLIGAYGLMFLTSALRRSAWGILSVFAFTGFMGYSLGPILNYYIAMGAGSTVIACLFATGGIFFSLSFWALVSRKDFTALSGFIVVGFWVLLLAVLANLFLKMTVFSTVISCCFVVFSSALILFQTSQIVRGGENNYIMATIGLYNSIYNIFISLLSIVGVGQNRD